MNGISTHREGRVLRIVLDRPHKLNAVNAAMLAELQRQLHAAAQASITVVVLSGAGRAFCSGGDLSGRDTDGAGELANEVIATIVDLPMPVVAGVHGAAAGVGCPLALACDLIVASRSAYFQLAFSKVGLMPDGGTAALLPAAIGRSRATRMAMLAEKIPASVAFEWGLVSHFVEDDDFDEELTSIVRILDTTSGPSLSWIKTAMRAGTMATLADMQALELRGQYALTATPEFRRAVSIFRQSARLKSD